MPGQDAGVNVSTHGDKMASSGGGPTAELRVTLALINVLWALRKNRAVGLPSVLSDSQWSELDTSLNQSSQCSLRLSLERIRYKSQSEVWAEKHWSYQVIHTIAKPSAPPRRDRRREREREMGREGETNGMEKRAKTVINSLLTNCHYCYCSIRGKCYIK